MNEQLEQKIRSRPRWTFQECAGLASEYNVKTRAVIAMVMMCGAEYVDHTPTSPPQRRSNPQRSES